MLNRTEHEIGLNVIRPARYLHDRQSENPTLMDGPIEYRTRTASASRGFRYPH